MIASVAGGDKSLPYNLSTLMDLFNRSGVFPEGEKIDLQARIWKYVVSSRVTNYYNDTY